MRRTKSIPTSILLSLSLSLLSSCAIRGDGKGLAYGVDGAAIVGGALMMATNGGCEKENDVVGLETEKCVAGSFASVFFGSAFILAGSIGLITNIAINVNSTNEPPKPIPMSQPQPVPMQPQPVPVQQPMQTQPVPMQPAQTQPVPMQPAQTQPVPLQPAQQVPTQPVQPQPVPVQPVQPGVDGDTTSPS